MTQRQPGCKCRSDSPFLWAQNVQASFAMSESTMRAQGAKGLTKAQTATQNIERLRENGQSMHTLHGLGNREAEITRLRDFKTYSKARRAKEGKVNAPS